ncbi:OmpP1/FadL family transporter [Williamwhitmania taraxaci]|uniref:Outer membrane protein transport protein (OMPP1/FadL/TodX) n=1 Tax=Williamwhitmania taraxaci TaxID=1640674 RepID=A0A1G6MW82_9BACT|nr:outer membrane protein transport protein [Williamwhitmania taraxaci]SDC59800.1 Outer membrane protein transport protein (OMPP1/FadL/TodX) [Williamwhitmania taraxaci]
MKKGLLFFAATLLSAPIFAGGILTNANQSAAYLRMIARDASTQIDAVYYNPAGLIKLQDGFHLSLNNQTLFSKRTIENKYPLLNESKYIGDVTVPFFPGIYAAYKTGDWVFSFGFNPSAGGGTASYGAGLPSFEIPFSGIPASLTASGIPTTAYTADIKFDGTSIFWGTQVGASYKINDMFSAYAGVRMINAVNTYEGELKNIRINPTFAPLGLNGTSFVKATEFFTNMASMFGSLAGIDESLQPLINGGGSALTLAQAQTANYLTPEQVASISGGFALINPSIDPSTLNIAQIQGAYAAASPTLLGKQAAMATNASNTQDQTVDVKQTGTGFTPIIGVNITPNDKINIGIKYEFKTTLELTNDTKKDVVTNMFPNGAKFRNDIPAILSVGIDYKVLPDLKLAAGLHHYFDKDANWEGKEKFVTDNLYELSFGMEYNVNEKILFSAGYLYAQTGVGQGYQTDISHSLSSSSVGFGGAFKASEMLTINLGILYTQYVQSQKDITYTNFGSVKETYNRNNIGFGIGFDFHF